MIKTEVYKQLSFDQLEKGRLNEAITSATECLRLDEKGHDCYQIRASAYYANGKLDDAIRDLTQFIKIKPESQSGYLSRGQIYAELENYDAAIADFTRALEIKFDSKLKIRLAALKIRRDAANKKVTKP